MGTRLIRIDETVLLTVYPQSMFLCKNKKNENYSTEFFQFLRLRKNLDPVVQSIVSLTISLRHKFVKQISSKVTNTLLFFVEKM